MQSRWPAWVLGERLPSLMARPGARQRARAGYPCLNSARAPQGSMAWHTLRSPTGNFDLPTRPRRRRMNPVTELESARIDELLGAFRELQAQFDKVRERLRRA